MPIESYYNTIDDIHYFVPCNTVIIYFITASIYTSQFPLSILPISYTSLPSGNHPLFVLCVCVFMCACSVSQSRLTLQSYGLQPTRLLCPWASPGKNTGEGCHSLLQRIFPTQGLNPCLLSPALAGGFFTAVLPARPHSPYL